MQIGTRVNLFFLAMLGIVLVGVAGVMHFLRLNQHTKEIEDQLNGSLNTLAAAVENRRGVLHWPTTSPRFHFGFDPAEDETRWLAANGHGDVLDSSENLRRLAAAGLRARLEEACSRAVSGRTREYFEDVHGDSWMDIVQVLESEHAEDGDGTPSRILLVAAASLQPGIDAGWNMLVLRGVVAVSVWFVVALLGNRISSRALRPLKDMASAVRAIPAGDMSRRIPQPDTNDEVAELSTAFNELMGRMEAAFERTQRFTGEASHQLRTPLTVLCGQVDVALRRDRSPAEYVETLKIVQAQGRRLSHLVELLLVLARADADRTLPNPEELDGAAWLAERLEEWRVHPRRADMRLNVAPGTIRIRVLPALLAEALDNLLENACKYSEPGTSIDVSIERAGTMARLRVADRGTGMAEADARRAFEPFFRSEDARRRGLQGYGIGLSIVKRIAEAMGGDARLESRRDEGTTVTIELPLA